MSLPTVSRSTSSVFSTGSLNINALLCGEKWGGVAGTGIQLTYSFPWATSDTAVFFGKNGIGDYSLLNEHRATYHYGLDSTEQAAVRGVIQSWSSVANITLSEITETTSNVGDIRIAFTSAENGEDVWGWGYYPDSWFPSAGDIWISTEADGAIYDTDWSVGSYNFNVLMHELGHVLGLKHPFEDWPVLPENVESQQYSIMSYTDHPHSTFVRVTDEPDGSVSAVSFSVVPDTPMLYDMAAIQYIYGANQSYMTGDDIYSFDPEMPFFRTLWDAGGVDTISVSNFLSGCTIDLREGHFSSIRIKSDDPSGINWDRQPPTPTYDGTDNLAIAFGCIIENAVGGSGDDTLVGNASNNFLVGAAGSDSIDGGIGIDVAGYSGSRSDYVLSQGGGGWTLASMTAGGEVDTLINVERLKFTEGCVAFDLDSMESAGKAMGFIGVVAPSLLNSTSVRGVIISRFDQGEAMEDLCQVALELNLIDHSTNMRLASAVFHNVTGGVATAEIAERLADYIYYHGQADFLAEVAGLHINVDLVGLQVTGVDYI